MAKSAFRTFLGRVIRARRKDLNISQESLGESADLHRTYVGGVERGERNIGLDNLQKISGALKLRLSGLIEAAERMFDRLKKGGDS